MDIVSQPLDLKVQCCAAAAKLMVNRLTFQNILCSGKDQCSITAASDDTTMPKRLLHEHLSLALQHRAAQLSSEEITVLADFCCHEFGQIRRFGSDMLVSQSKASRS